MNDELISKKTRHEFREFLVSWTLREIEMEFDSADIAIAKDYAPNVGGQRRGLVEQYYHSLDFANPGDVKKLLKVYENVLNTTLSRTTDASPFGGADYAEQTRKAVERLASWLKKDGYVYRDGKIPPSAGIQFLDDAQTIAFELNADYVSRQVKRMRDSVDTDTEVAIGTAKEFVETICKTILMERGKPISGTPDIPTLTKMTLKELNLVPEGIEDSSRGSDIIKRLLQNLGTIGNGLAELRGLYGTGHGKHGKAKGLAPRHAKLAVGAAVTMATFLFETHKERER